MKLETERLILRKPRISDSIAIAEGLGNIKVAKFLGTVKHPYDKKDAEDWIKCCLKEWNKKNKKTYYFFIELKSEKKIIGALDLKIKNKRIGATGSWINEKYHKKGYMTEAKIAVNEFAFNEMNLEKLETDTHDNNIASQSTQEAVGYKKEGVRIKHSECVATGKIYDAHLYGLMKSDWKKTLPKLKKHLKEKIKKLKK